MFSLYHYKKIAPRFTSSFYPKSDRLLAHKLIHPHSSLGCDAEVSGAIEGLTTNRTNHLKVNRRDSKWPFLS